MSMMKCLALLPVLTQVICDQLVPSSPEIFYGGFVPMLQIDSALTANEDGDTLPEERNSRHLPFLENAVIENKRNSRFFRFNEGDARNQLKKTYFSKNIIPLHKNSNPEFPLEIPEKNKFTVKDAVVGELPIIEEDSVKSEQFQIFNFLSNVRLPKFPDILSNMIQRPSGPPQPVNHKPQPPRPQFFPSPQNNLNTQNHKIPNHQHQHQSSHSHEAHEALTVFNQGLDNFIQNPASLAHGSRPVNG